MAEQLHGENAVIVALLHNVVEDTAVTLDDLRQAGFDENIIEALTLLTHITEMAYLDYINLIKQNPLARVVKLEDLKHNCNTSRGGDNPNLKAKRESCYYPAIEIIEKAIKEDKKDC